MDSNESKSNSHTVVNATEAEVQAMAILNGSSAKSATITKDVLQSTAAKIGVTVPKPVEDELTVLMADGCKIMEEVSAMEGQCESCLFT